MAGVSWQQAKNRCIHNGYNVSLPKQCSRCRRGRCRSKLLAKLNTMEHFRLTRNDGMVVIEQFDNIDCMPWNGEFNRNKTMAETPCAIVATAKYHPKKMADVLGKLMCGDDLVGYHLFGR